MTGLRRQCSGLDKPESQSRRIAVWKRRADPLRLQVRTPTLNGVPHLPLRDHACADQRDLQRKTCPIDDDKDTLEVRIVGSAGGSGCAHRGIVGVLWAHGQPTDADADSFADGV